MRLLIAVRPDTEAGWIDAALRALPWSPPLDIVLLSAVHVSGPPLTSVGGHARGLYWGALAALRREAERTARQAADRIRTDIEGRASRVVVRIVSARPATAIARAAAAWGAELVLLGASVHGALGRALFGSVVTDVIRWAPCPVLIVGRPVREVQRVLIATDGSVHAEAAVRFLTSVAERPPSEVRVCAITEIDGAGWAARLHPRRLWGVKDRTFADRQAQTARRSLADAQEILGVRAWPAQPSLRTGDVYREFADELRRWPPDLLVFGAKGRTAGPEAAIGSLAGRLLDRMPCPSLVVRAA